jgi:hypothetical protein
MLTFQLNMCGYPGNKSVLLFQLLRLLLRWAIHFLLQCLKNTSTACATSVFNVCRYMHRVAGGTIEELIDIGLFDIESDVHRGTVTSVTIAGRGNGQGESSAVFNGTRSAPRVFEQVRAAGFVLGAAPS